MNPKVSIIITTYNSEKFLSRTINSVLNQTFRDWELIIVDDFSTDNTKEIIKEFEKRDQRIKSIFLDKNFGGPAKPLNIGINISKGEYFALLEHDDEWLPQKLEKQIEILDKFPEIKLVTCWANIYVNNKLKKIYKPHPRLDINYLADKGIITFSTIIFRKKITKEIWFDENMKRFSDIDFYFSVLNKNKGFVIKEALVNYFIHGENLSHSYLLTLEGAKEIEYFINKHLNTLKLYKRLYSELLRTLGTIYLLNNEYKKSKEYFKKSISVSPLNFRNYINFILSNFPNLYKKVLFLKRKIF